MKCKNMNSVASLRAGKIRTVLSATAAGLVLTNVFSCSTFTQQVTRFEKNNNTSPPPPPHFHQPQLCLTKLPPVTLKSIPPLTRFIPLPTFT